MIDSDFTIGFKQGQAHGKQIMFEKIEDIKAEIESKLYSDNQVQNNIDALTMSVYNNAILDALSIIDSHISGKEKE